MGSVPKGFLDALKAAERPAEAEPRSEKVDQNVAVILHRMLRDDSEFRWSNKQRQPA
jgi:hypothetical protein